MGKSPRKSLNELFDNLAIGESSSSPSSKFNSPEIRMKMRQSLRKSFSKGWPQRSSEDVFITISSDAIYRQSMAIQKPEDLFEKASGWISVMQEMSLDERQKDVLTNEIQEAMIRAIFGSNQIERAGLDLEITVQLCRKVFAGEIVGEITERDPDYESALLELYHKQSGLKNMPSKYILRARNEVVQHARAFLHIINAFVVEKRDLDEDLIKDTHRILTTGVPLVEDGYPDISPKDYGGKYRTVIVGAGSTNFTVPKFVPAKMKEMCENLKKDLESAETSKKIDPFSIATKYSLEFVSIHPFRDGNGRMCRMILNALLCRYAGIIVPIGEQGEEREEYMAIKRRASAEMDGHGEYATFVLSRATTRIREMKKKMTGRKK